MPHPDIRWQPGPGPEPTEAYHLARIWLDGKPLSQLANLGLAIDHCHQRPGLWVQTDLSETELQLARQAGFRVQVQVPNIAQHYAQRAQAELSQPQLHSPAAWACFGTRGFQTPEHFKMGSMGGFYTLAQLYADLDSMALLYPNLITPRLVIDSTLPTHNGNYVYYLRVAQNVAVLDTARPQVLYTALHHSREPNSMQALVYTLWWLLENYGTDAEATYLLDHFTLFFVPCVNPDGYLHNESTNPGGGGMWRKNRRNNGNGTIGVDLNRNYGYEWGYDNTGSSPNSSSDTYRGPSAFSEPETQSVKALCEANRFLLAFNYHTFSDLLIYPWGYIESFTTPDQDEFEHYGSHLTEQNYYLYGTGDQTVNYVTNGDSDDWMYGEQGTKNKIYSMTPEAGAEGDGFWPSPARILPLCVANHLANLRLAHLAGHYGIVEDRTGPFLGGTYSTFHFGFQRLGLQDGGTYTLTVTSPDGALAAPAPVLTISSPDTLQWVEDSLALVLSPSLQTGDPFRLVVELNNGYYTYRDTITKWFGQRLVLLNDDMGNDANWASANWAATTALFRSPPASLTDSPLADYPNNSNRACTTAVPLDLRGVSRAELHFYSQWFIEANYDYATVEVKPVSGGQWTPACGRQSHPGTPDQGMADEPVYDARQGVWVREEIDLTDYAGMQVLIRFRLYADPGVRLDGIYIDDLTVYGLDTTALSTVGSVGLAQGTFGFGAPRPNPATTQLSLPYHLPSHPQQCHLRLVDGTGRVVLAHTAQCAGTGVVPLALPQALAPGVYTLVSTVGDVQATRRVVVAP
jgi:hypothetical protein